MPLTRPNPTRRDAGITLIELVVAVFILALGTIAALRVVDQSRLLIGGTEARLLADMVALNRAEEIKLLGVAEARDLPDSVLLGPVTWSVDQTEEPTVSDLIAVTIAVSAPDSPGARLTVWAPEVVR